MAQFFMGLDRGAQDSGPDEVSTDTSDTGTDIQIVVVTGTGVQRIDIKLIVEALLRYVEDGRLDTTFPE